MDRSKRVYHNLAIAQTKVFVIFHIYLLSSKRLMRLDTRPFPIAPSTPPSMLGLTDKFPDPSGKETSVTGLLMCAGLGGTAGNHRVIENMH